jgi:hypothetical protein
MWNPVPPTSLVIACSDGRLWRELDVYLAVRLGVAVYDRICLPGGPAALFRPYGAARADASRQALDFLTTAHGIRHLIFVFHGADADGPTHAQCADYAQRSAEPEAEQCKDAARLKTAFSARTQARLTFLFAMVGRGGLMFVNPRCPPEQGQGVAA